MLERSFPCLYPCFGSSSSRRLQSKSDASFVGRMKRMSDSIDRPARLLLTRLFSATSVLRHGCCANLCLYTLASSLPSFVSLAFSFRRVLYCLIAFRLVIVACVAQPFATHTGVLSVNVFDQGSFVELTSRRHWTS